MTKEKTEIAKKTTSCDFFLDPILKGQKMAIIGTSDFRGHIICPCDEKSKGKSK